MKKNVFIILVASLLSACLSTPSQLTVTPEATSTLPPTPIPTPTLHPDFIALQESIIASGTRFSLQADGHIYDGETPIPGLTVASNGTITLVVNGETTTLAPADVDFDDENGITIDGYSQDPENGSWGEAVNPAMTEIIDLLGQYQIDPETYTITEDEDGVVSVTMKVVESGEESEKIVMRSSEFGIQHDLEFAVDGIAANSCESKPEFQPRTSTGRVPFEISKKLLEYIRVIRDELGYYGGTNFFTNVLIDRKKVCWGHIGDGYNLLYRDENGVARLIKLIPVSEEEAWAFATDR
ncbi:MAG: hypothetical protein J0M11_00195 [Anaerolineae bacterium]|nr:hypothetical protein [Anaerolineae bacterium]